MDGPQNLFSTLAAKWSTGGSNASYALGIYGGSLTFGLTSAGGDNQGIGSGNDYDDGLWHHAAGTWDGTMMRLYVDGFEVNSNTPAGFGTISNTSLNFIIGADASGQADRFFDGQIDEVRVWNVERSQAEIQSGIHTQLQGDETGLAAYWTFNQATAGGTNTGLNILYDRTANGNDGTLTSIGLSGASSNWVTSGSQHGIPVDPTNLFTTEAAGQIDLSWTDHAFNETGYTIERSDGNISSFSVFSYH